MVFPGFDGEPIDIVVPLKLQGGLLMAADRPGNRP